MTRRIVSAELEDRVLRVLIVEGSGRRQRVISNTMSILPGDSALDVANALRAAVGVRRCGQYELMLALRHRRVTCGEVMHAAVRVPQEIVRVLGSEARKLGVYGDDEDLVVGYRRRKTKRLEADVCVAPRELVSGIAEGVRGAGFKRVRLLASEAVLAHGLTQTLDGDVAILDVQSDRALLLLARAGHALVARRFKLAMPHTTEPDNGQDVAPLLFGELMRSLTFFREQGRGEATRVLLSGPFAADGALVQAMSSLLPIPVSAASMPALLDLDATVPANRGQVVPRLALQGPLGNVPHFVEPPRVAPRRVAAVALLQVAGAAAAVSGGVMWSDASTPRARALIVAMHGKRAECQALQSEIDGLRTNRQPSAAVQARIKILADLDGATAARSALCAAIASGRPESLALTSIELDAEGTLTLTGIARTDDRLTALRALAELEAWLRRVPGLGDGRSALGEAVGSAQIDFRFSARLSERQP